MFRYSAEFASPEKLRIACEMTQPHYGHEYVPCDIAEQWRLVNPKAFIQILNREGELCACFGVLALKPTFMDPFIAGKMSDTHLNGNDILSLLSPWRSDPMVHKRCDQTRPSTIWALKRATVMLWVILRYLRHIYGLKRKRQLYAIAVTKESRLLLEHLKFQKIGDAKHRVDKCDLYCYDLNICSVFSGSRRLVTYVCVSILRLSGLRIATRLYFSDDVILELVYAMTSRRWDTCVRQKCDVDAREFARSPMWARSA